MDNLAAMLGPVVFWNSRNFAPSIEALKNLGFGQSAKCG